MPIVSVLEDLKSQCWRTGSLSVGGPEVQGHTWLQKIRGNPGLGPVSGGRQEPARGIDRVHSFTENSPSGSIKTI